MNSNRLRIVVCLAASILAIWSACDGAVAEVVAVPTGDAARSPTLTMYWEGADSKAVFMLIPGGEGQLHLKPDQIDVGNQFYQTLKQLSVGTDPKEIFDVVLFDSPEYLD